MTRRGKVLKWTGSVAALIAIALVAYGWWAWLTNSRLERQLAAIRAAGDPLTLDDLARPPISPAKNAATYLRRAEAGAAAIEQATMKLLQVSEYPGFLMPPEDQKIVKAALAAHPDVIPLLEQAAACPDYDAELDYTLSQPAFLAKSLDALTKPRAVTRVLRHRGALLVAEGKRDEAVRTAQTIFRLARHFDHHPLIVGYLVTIVVRDYAIRTANEALQTGPVSKAVREALDAELAIQERMEGFVWALKSERACTLAYFDETLPGLNPWPAMFGVWNSQEAACLESYSTFLTLAHERGPYRDVQPTAAMKKATLVAPLSTSLKMAYAAMMRSRATIRALRVLNALQTRVPPGSKETPKLTNLGLPTEVITDPFTGQPLHVKKTPRGWLVYSVGKNLRDDGGKVDDSVNGDVGVGPPPVAKPAEKGQDGKAKEGGG